MRKLKRQTLSSRSLKVLKQRTAKVTAKTTKDEKVKEVERLWGSKNNKTFEEIKSKLLQMASGIERCMYCEDSAGTDIEHFKPKSTYPLSAFDWENYLIACSACNSNYKRTQFPLDEQRQPLLIDPTKEDPSLHIALSPSTGRYVNITDKGMESIRVYGLNRSILVLGRSDALVSVQVLIIRYGEHRQNGNMDKARHMRKVVCRFPHASVFIVILNIADSPVSTDILDPDCIRTLQQYPEIRDWMS
ncbi:MAG: hypothetical protein GY757_35085 [bacterium]|nr:hypothetical protein [bacterium]